MASADDSAREFCWMVVLPGGDVGSGKDFKHGSYNS